MLAVSNSCHIKPSPAKVIWEATLSRVRYLLMPGYHCPPDGRIQGYQPSIAIRPLTLASKFTVRCLILAWNPAASVTKLPKWAPIPPPPPKFYFAEETFGTVRPPRRGGGEYIGGRGDPIIQIISPPVFAWIISLGATVSTRALRRSLLIFDCIWRR